MKKTLHMNTGSLGPDKMNSLFAKQDAHKRKDGFISNQARLGSR